MFEPFMLSTSSAPAATAVRISSGVIALTPNVPEAGALVGDPGLASAAVDDGALLVDIRPEAQRRAEGEVPGALVIEHALRDARIAPEPDLVAAVLKEVKRIREERAERSDFSDFHRRYYDHLNRLGLTADEVVDIARALIKN